MEYDIIFAADSSEYRVGIHDDFQHDGCIIGIVVVEGSLSYQRSVESQVSAADNQLEGIGIGYIDAESAQQIAYAEYALGQLHLDVKLQAHSAEHIQYRLSQRLAIGEVKLYRGSLCVSDSTLKSRSLVYAILRNRKTQSDRKRIAVIVVYIGVKLRSAVNQINGAVNIQYIEMNAEHAEQQLVYRIRARLERYGSIVQPYYLGYALNQFRYIERIGIGSRGRRKRCAAIGLLSLRLDINDIVKIEIDPRQQLVERVGQYIHDCGIVDLNDIYITEQCRQICIQVAGIDIYSKNLVINVNSLIVLVYGINADHSRQLRQVIRLTAKCYSQLQTLEIGYVYIECLTAIQSVASRSNQTYQLRQKS